MPPATPYLPRSGSVHSSPVEAFSPRVISQRTRDPLVRITGRRAL
jgi:hypothetical protein